jgi:hypothetical protein
LPSPELGREWGEDEREQQRVQVEAVCDVEHLVDEDLSAADDRSKCDQELQDDRGHRRRVVAGYVHDQRLEPLLRLDRAAVPKRPGRIRRVGADENDGARDLQRLRGSETKEQRDRQARHEEAEISLESPEVDGGFEPLRAPLAIDERRHSDERHRDRCQKQRSANDRADRDVVGTLVALDDGDHRNQRLRQGRRDSREQAPDGALPELELAAEPLDRIREEQRACEKDGKACWQQNDRTQAENYPRTREPIGPQPRCKRCIPGNGSVSDVDPALTAALRGAVGGSDPSCLRIHRRTGCWHVAAAIDLEDRQRNVKRLANAIDEVTLLPGAVIGRAQGDQDVVGPKSSNSVGEGAQGRLVSYRARGGSIRSQGLDLSHHRFQTLVRLLPHAIGVGCEPLKAIGQHRGDHQDLGR